MKKVMAVLSLVVLCFGVNSLAAPGDLVLGQEGNGGAGIGKDGKYVTFFSSGIFISKIPERSRAIPGLLPLMAEFNDFPGLSSNVKASWFSNIQPDSNRKYYRVLESQIEEGAIDKLIEKYKKAVNPAEVDQDIAIFAITDKETRTTLLLPKFYELTDVEQKAILFHEAYWLVFPKATYRKVIDAEVTFQEYLETRDPISAVEFLTTVNQFDESLFFAVDYDLKNDALGDLVQENKVSMVDFLGYEYVKCLSEYTRAHSYYEKYMEGALSTCRRFFEENIYQKLLLYPDSMIFYLLSDMKIHLKAHFERRTSLISKYSIEQLASADVELVKYGTDGVHLKFKVGVDSEGEELDQAELLLLIQL